MDTPTEQLKSLCLPGEEADIRDGDQGLVSVEKMIEADGANRAAARLEEI